VAESGNHDRIVVNPDADGASERDVRYASAFFDLQFEFAERVSLLSRLALPRTLLEYTNLYIRFGLGRDFDPAHPGWQEFLAGLRETDDGRAWTYRFFLTRPPAPPPPGLVATSGCFAYARLGDGRTRLHFRNAETDGQSPLAKDRRACRRAELAVLFAELRRTVRQPPRVVGASWLYNLRAYRDLFPDSYVATARVIHGRFRHMPLWGQFLNRHGEVRENIACEFRERLARQTSTERLDDCFPFQVLAVEAPAPDFYAFYGV
jgi:hypothetical protein